MTKEQDKKRIEAIVAERAGYVRLGKKDRVAACDAELKRLGYEDPDAPKERKAPESQKAKADQHAKQEG